MFAYYICNKRRRINTKYTGFKHTTSLSNFIKILDKTE